jgi:MFS family permease
MKKPLLVIFLTVFIDLVGFGIIIPLSPYLASHFGASAFKIGLLMAIYSAMQFLFSPFWGGLSDRYGRRPIILVSLLGAGFAHLTFAFATTYTMLFMARLFAGIFGANISTAMAYIADITEPNERSKGMGMIGAAFGLGFILGPALGGLFGHIGEMLGSQPPFGKNFSAVVAFLICMLNVGLAYRYLNESLNTKHKSDIDRSSRLKKISNVLSRPIVGPLVFTFFLASLAMAHMEATLFLYVKDEFSWTMTQASLGFAYVGVMMVITQGYLIRKLMPKIGERKLLITGLSMTAVGLALIGFSHHLALLTLAVTLLGIGTGLTNPSLSGSVSLLTKDNEQGSAMGVSQSLQALGRIVGPVLGGYFYQTYSFGMPFFAAGFFTFCGLLLVLRLYKFLPQTGKTASSGGH